VAGYRTDALVLKKRKLGEADNVLILASPTEGRIDAIARGVRKTSSRFGGRLEPFSMVQAILHKGRTFDTVTSVQVSDAHDGLRGDPERTSYAAVVVDVLDKVMVRGDPEPRLVALADATLTAMETEGADLGALMVAFALKTLAMLGLRPALESCAACGGTLVGGAHLSAAAGGAVCDRCRGELPDAASMTKAAREAMAELLGETMAEVAARAPEPLVRGELYSLTRTLLNANVHGRLKSLEFLARQPSEPEVD